MKQFICFFLISFSVLAQNFSVIQEKTNSYSGLLTAENLAKNINRDFKTDEDKVKAIYAWLTRNIRYDLKEFYNSKRKKNYSFSYQTIEELEEKKRAINDSIVTKVLASRRAVCEGYARTFSKICTLLHIENSVVDGYVKTSSFNINKPIFTPNHAWNAIKINQKWIFIDATWGAGYENNGKWYRKFNPYYFNIPKTSLFKTHLPDKLKWKLQVGRMSKQEFYSQPIYSSFFLTSNAILITPKNGTLHKKDGNIKIQLKNLDSSRQIHIGFSNEPFALTPNVSVNNGVTTIVITPPANSKQAYLMIDKEVVLEFLIAGR